MEMPGILSYRIRYEWRCLVLKNKTSVVDEKPGIFLLWGLSENGDAWCFLLRYSLGNGDAWY